MFKTLNDTDLLSRRRKNAAARSQDMRAWMKLHNTVAYFQLSQQKLPNLGRCPKSQLLNLEKPSYHSFITSIACLYFVRSEENQKNSKYGFYKGELQEGDVHREELCVCIDLSFF